MPKRIDITGQKFAMLTAITEVAPSGKNRKYLFECECGKRIITQMSAVKYGNTQSCGCLQSKTVSKILTKDLTGQTFGRLTVLERAPSRGISRSTRWICKCRCGKVHEAQATNLISGNTQSCGCNRLT